MMLNVMRAGANAPEQSCAGALSTAKPTSRPRGSLGPPAVGHPRLEELPNERGRQRLVEVKGALGLAVALDVTRERLERRSAERVVGAALRGRGEARDDLALESERGETVADALLDLRHERMNRLS